MLLQPHEADASTPRAASDKSETELDDDGSEPGAPAVSQAPHTAAAALAQEAAVPEVAGVPQSATAGSAKRGHAAARQHKLSTFFAKQVGGGGYGSGICKPPPRLWRPAVKREMERAARMAGVKEAQQKLLEDTAVASLAAEGRERARERADSALTAAIALLARARARPSIISARAAAERERATCWYSSPGAAPHPTSRRIIAEFTSSSDESSEVHVHESHFSPAHQRVHWSHPRCRVL